MRLEKPVIWLLLLATTYTLGHTLWYWQTPLGQLPVLDGLENLNLADQIAIGALAPEPFYRALLYPALLAILPVHWMVLGIVCHLANTLLAALLAKRIWNRISATLIAGALVGFNPVLLHFALDPLDTTLSITLLLLGLYFLLPSQNETVPRAGRAAAAGLFLALAALARPHIFAILLPLIGLAGVAGLIWKRERAGLIAFSVVATIPLITFGLIQQAHSGSFRILPTQGAYNFWASNNADANGLYFRQTLNFHYTDEHKNPTRLESEQLYLRETGEVGTVDERSAYWRGKTIDYIAANPVVWAKLFAFKTYAWLNNFEQYNNKTFAFHKDLSPYLKYNPISWGLLIVLGTLILILAKTGVRERRFVWAIIGLVALYSAGALLYMASARFRLPLVPLLAVVAGGLPLAIAQWKAVSPTLRIGSLAACLGVAVLAFSNFGNVVSTETYQQDTMLLADASARAGRDLDAFRWSEATLALNPQRQDARRLRILSFYNLVATGRDGATGKTWEDFRDDLALISLSDPYIDFVKGVALWGLQQPEQAREVWTDTFHRHAWDASSSLAALIYTDSNLGFSVPRYPSSHNRPNPLLTFALNRPDQSNLRERMGFPFAQPPETRSSIATSFQRVLPPQPNP